MEDVCYWAEVKCPACETIWEVECVHENGADYYRREDELMCPDCEVEAEIVR